MTNTIILGPVYKRTSTGATQIWQVEVDAENARYRTLTGQIDGAKTTTEWTVCNAKNVGRANEVTAADQALKQAEAAMKKKLAQGGYHRDLAEIDQAKFFKPMLAKKVEDYDIWNMGGRVCSQPKLDGIRCIANRDGLWTRQGKPITSCPHIIAALTEVFKADPDIVIDGELYNHDLKNDFNQIVSLVRKAKPSDADLIASAEMIQFWVYDVPSADRFEQRFARLESLQVDSTRVKIVPTVECVTQGHLDTYYGQYIEEGYEGQMVRISSDDFPYVSKRCKSLLKRKDFLDEEFEIIGVEEGDGNRSGMAGRIVYRMKDGSTFSASITGGVAINKQIWAERDQYIGGVGTVKFFEYTPSGKPRFPTTVIAYKGDRDV